MIERVIVLVGVIVLVFGAGLAIQPTYESAVEGANNASTVSNETITASVGEKTLTESNRDVVYQDQDKVTVTQNGSTIVADGNYSWRSSNGTLEVLSSTTMNTSEDATVSYGYTVPDGEQRLARDVGLVPAQLGGALTSILGAVLLLGSVAVVVKVVA